MAIREAKCRTDDDRLVSVSLLKLVVPSDEDATKVAQPQHTSTQGWNLASSHCSYCGSAAGNDGHKMMPNMDHVRFTETHLLCRCQRQMTIWNVMAMRSR